MRSLLAVPNVSAGPERAVLEPLVAAFCADAALLDRHSDAVHGRSVLTLAGSHSELAASLRSGAEAATELIDLRRHMGAHPRIGALDVSPIVYPRPEQAEAATELAHTVAAAFADLGLPVFLYGSLASSEERRERHYFRRGGIEALRARMDDGLEPDLGPPAPHPTAGAVLVTARPPLAAFNVELEGASMEGAEELAAHLRESGGGMDGVRAIAIRLGPDRIQISTNVHDPLAIPLRDVVAEIHRLAVPVGGRAVAAELIGLIPERALDGYPEDVPIRGFDPATRTIEARLRALE